jgi:hypothetical protein
MPTLRKGISAPDWMIINAFRFAVGRMTPVVAETADWLVGHWPELSPAVRDQIRYELEHAFARDDEARGRVLRPTGLPLGMTQDRWEWVRVRALWEGTDG